MTKISITDDIKNVSNTNKPTEAEINEWTSQERRDYVDYCESNIDTDYKTYMKIKADLRQPKTEARHERMTHEKANAKLYSEGFSTSQRVKTLHKNSHGGFVRKNKIPRPV